MTIEKKLETRTLTGAGGPEDDWILARKCRGCGRFLTSPASIAAGIGPSCAQREAR